MIRGDRAFPADAVIMLGYPRFYLRSGFSAEKAAKLTAPSSGRAFMALEIETRILDRDGSLAYPVAFGL